MAILYLFIISILTSSSNFISASDSFTQDMVIPLNCRNGCSVVINDSKKSESSTDIVFITALPVEINHRIIAACSRAVCLRLRATRTSLADYLTFEAHTTIRFDTTTEEIKQIPSYRKLHKGYCWATGAQPFYKKLQNENSEITASLFLSDRLKAKYVTLINFDPVGLLIFFNALEKNQYPIALELSRNALGCDQIIALTPHLKTSTKVHTLNVSHNYIGNDGASALAQILSTNTTLTVLDVGYKQVLFLDSTNINTLMSTLKENHTLQVLYIDGSAQRYGVLRILSPQTLITVLQYNTALTKLYLPRCDIQAGGVALLLAHLKINTALKDLTIGTWEMNDADTNALSKIGKTDLHLNSLSLRGGYHINHSLAEQTIKDAKTRGLEIEFLGNIDN